MDILLILVSTEYLYHIINLLYSNRVTERVSLVSVYS